MGTRGFLGIRNNKKLLSGKYNTLDSYYDGLGKDVVDCYFDGNGMEILSLSDGGDEEDITFLQNGLYCEFAYVYNKDNDTLEIYRGFFKKKQNLNANTKTKIIDALEDKKEEEYYCHLIMIIDRKTNTKEQVLEAFHRYDDIHNEEEVGENYPERKIIPFKINKEYIPLV